MNEIAKANTGEIIITDTNGLLTVSSLQVARDFGKEHKNVVQSIENIKAENSAVTPMFIESAYKAGTGKNYKCYELTRDGFSLLVMGFTGKKALEWKLKYIEAFNKMEQMIREHQKQLSPIEMIASIANNAVEMERKQKLIEAKQAEQEIAIADTNKRLDNMCDVISLDKNSWRKDAKSLIVKIAGKIGSGCDCINCVYDEIYKALESRAGVSLGIRLTNKRNRMLGEGICKSKVNQLNKMDIIADDKKLIEIYVAIVKEMAIKYGVC